MKLRPYQIECRDNVLAELRNGSKSTLAVMPTGTGKTVVFGHVAQEWTRKTGSRVLVLAHREELIFQARDKIGWITGHTPDVEMAEFRASRSGLFGDSNVVVSSIQTQNAGRQCDLCGGKGTLERDGVESEPCPECLEGLVRRMQRFDPREFGLLIIDEAHHATAETYQRVIRFYSEGNPDLRVMGVTATPDRHDEAALGQIFDSVAFEYGILDAINDGWLVPIHQEFVTCEDLDFSAIRTTAGDLNGGDLAEVMEEERALHGVAGPTLEIAGNRPTLVFATSVAHADRMAEIFNRHKPDSAICIHGGTPAEQRRNLLKRYSRGEFQFLVGCGVFLEGFDEPRIEVVAMARPTKSRALYAQAVGRGTRPVDPPTQETPEARKAAIAASAKPRVHVLDFVGNAGRHKLVTTADILGGNYADDVIERAVQEAKKRGGCIDMQAELFAAERATLEEKRRERSQLTSKAKYSRQQIDPFDVFDMTPEREAEYHRGKPASDKQKTMLERVGINTRGMTRHQASRLIGEVIRRRESGECSYKQARLLSRFGFDTHVGFQEASSIIDAIASNGWKRPVEEPAEVPF